MCEVLSPYLFTCRCNTYMIKELPRGNRIYDPVEDQKSQLLSFSAILLEFCSILVKFFKNQHFTEFHSLLKENFEEKSYVLSLYIMENGKVFLNHCPPPLDDTAIPNLHDFIFIKEVDTTNGVLYREGGDNVIHNFWYFG